MQISRSTRSTNLSIVKLQESGISGEKIREALISQSVELIFTAHPTQVPAASRHCINMHHVATFQGYNIC